MTDAPQPPAAEDATRFLLELGRLLLIAGDAVSDIERRMGAIATRWGIPAAQFMVLPNSVVVTAGPREGAQLATTVDLETSSLRLDQVTRLFTIARDAERGSLGPVDGLTALQAVPTMPSRYRTPGFVIGQVILVVGIALIGGTSEVSLFVYALLALIVAALRLIAARLGELDAVLPVFTATVVSLTAFLLTGREADAASVQALIPPLVTLLPGALLTMATVDLAAGETVAGASRFLAGVLQLALLAFGIVLGAELAGITPATEAGAVSPSAWIVPWLGIVVFASGIALQGSVLPSMVPWLLVVLFATFAGQQLGEALVGSELSGFVGGMVAAPLAFAVERMPNGPPAFVAFLPAFWLMVPGAVSLIGVSQIFIADPLFGIIGFLDALVAIVAIALGVLVGVRVTRAAQRARRPVGPSSR